MGKMAKIDFSIYQVLNHEIPNLTTDTISRIYTIASFTVSEAQ